jgi:uncharacterized protein YtpQ (UPF0354 family)
MGFFDRFFGPPSEDKFAKIMTRALRRAGDDRETTYDKAEFRLLHSKDGKAAGVTNLRNLYTEYCNAPKSARDALLARTCKGLLNSMEIPDDFDDVRPDLLPTVRTRSMLDVLRLDAEIAGGQSIDVPWLPLTDHLVVCLVYDLPSSMRFVSQENLDTWGVTLDEAVEVARKNLEEHECSVMALGEKLFILENGDAYDGTRILMTDLIGRFELAGEPIALPITRDCLMVAGSQDIEGLNLMLALAQEKTGNARPLCPIPIHLVDEKWESWLLPSNHVHFHKFKELELSYLASQYGDQKHLMDKRNEMVEHDVFVASFTVTQRGENLRSFGVWSKTVTTWLPKTDYVALYDPETQQSHFVPWQTLQEIAGDLMKPLDYYPPRFLVDGFPTNEQIANMQPEIWSK